MVFQYVLLLTFPAIMAFAGSIDLLTMTIPNRVSLALVATFPLAAAFIGMEWTTFASHLGAGALMLVVGIGMFARGWLGGGDAKLLAAAALWFGFEHLAGYLLLVAIAGGALSLLVLSYRNWVPPAWMLGQAWAMRLHDRKVGIPYGIALAAAALWIYPSTPWFAGFAA
ncbi:MAG: prepilin peptidase [Hyphomicrobiaceae bacterium]